MCLKELFWLFIHIYTFNLLGLKKTVKIEILYE